MSTRASSAVPTDLVHRHERIGWWGLFVFAGVGLGLEVLHGWKVQAYLSADHETRRLLWTLGHAHGVLLALVHLSFAGTLARRRTPLPRAGTIGALLVAAIVLLPGGFLAAGIDAEAGDPGLAIALVPVGAVSLLAALGLAALGAGRGGSPLAAPGGGTATTPSDGGARDG